MKTLIIDGEDMTQARDIILSGGMVAVPTETVYGLSVNGLDEAAVKAMYEAKNRPETKPINLLVPDMSAVESFCRDIPQEAYLLAEKFWPGPLTMILFKRDNVPDIVTAGGKTVGVRCPDHQKTLALLKLCRVPLATPSANISGMASPKSLDDVLGYFDGKIHAAIDGGRCSVGIESTILDLTASPPKILRQGGLSRNAIEEVLGHEVIV